MNHGTDLMLCQSGLWQTHHLSKSNQIAMRTETHK